VTLSLLPGSQSIAETGACVAAGQRIVVVAHVNPDADAIGSVLGLALGLRALGKDVTAALSDVVPEYARFLRGADSIGTQLPSEPLDLIICTDSASIERIGDLYTANTHRFVATTIVNIDHHRTNPLYGRVNYVDAAASSTSELIVRLLCELGVSIGPEAADALLFGVVGDTGSFRNGATTPGSLVAAAQLVEQGADIQRIAFQLFESKRFVAAHIWGRVVSAAELDSVRGIVFAYLSQQMLRECGATVDETEGIAEYLRGVQEAEVVMLLKETEDGAMRVSMRSRPSVDVSAIASALDGGGHRQAAGCTIPGPYSRARATLVEAFDHELERLT